MPTFLSPADIVGEKIKEATQATLALFKDAVRPIYASTNGGRPTHLGSCLLLKLNQVPLLLTAAHLIDQAKSDDLHVLGAKKLIPIRANFTSTVAPAGNRQLDRYDFAIAPLSEAMENQLGSVSYITDRQILTTAVPAKRFLVAIGYPNSKNKKIVAATKKITPVACTYGATVTNDPIRYDACNVSPQEHMLISFDSGKSATSSGDLVNSIAPSGLSGGGLFYLGNIVALDYIEEGKHPEPRLIGLLIENKKKQKAMLAVKLSTILETRKVRKLYSLVD